MTAALLNATYKSCVPIRVHLGLDSEDSSSEGTPRQLIVATRRETVEKVNVSPNVYSTMSDICNAVIRFQLRSGFRSVLSKGWRLQDDSILNFSGSTNRDQLMAREWSALLKICGSGRMFDMLSSPDLAVFRSLGNSSLLQITGVPLDEELRVALKQVSIFPRKRASLPTSTSSTGTPCSFGCLPGTWALPRSDARVPFSQKGFTLRYCRPLFYAPSSRSGGGTRHGLPLWHVLNTSCRLSRPQGKSVSFAKNKNAAQLAPSGNAARRLLSHIFVYRPHMRDAVVYNGADPNQSSSFLGAISASSHPPVLGSSLAVTEEFPLWGPPAVRLEIPDLPLPVVLAAAVTSFVELLSRHRHCAYHTLLNAHCPRTDILTRSSTEILPLDIASDTSHLAQAGNKRKIALGSVDPALIHGQLPVQKRRRLHVRESSRESEFLPVASREGLRDSSHADALLPAAQCVAAPLVHITPTSAVVEFVRACLGRVLPPALWGCNVNRRHIMRLVWQWISSGKRDRFRMADLLEGCRVSEYKVFSSRASMGNGASGARQQAALVQTWLAWILLGYVTPLLRASFYVTDSEVHHHRPLYFRRETWDRLSAAAVLKLRETLKLSPVDSASAASAFGNTSLGCAGMRLSPKRTCLRPIMNMASASGLVSAHLHAKMRAGMAAESDGATRTLSAASASATLAAVDSVSSSSTTFLGGSRAGALSSGATGGPIPGAAKPVNKQLEATHEILKLARRSKLGNMGSAVFGMDGIFASMRRFSALRGRRVVSALTAALDHVDTTKNSLMQSSNFPGEIGRLPLSALAQPQQPPLYLFCCDASAAYDNVIQSLAQQHIEEILGSVSRYEVRSYAEVSASGWAIASSPALNSEAARRATIAAARTRFRKVAVACDGGLVPFRMQASAMASECHNTVFIDGSLSESMSREQCLASISKVLWQHHVVSPDGQVWRQLRGIPQGSIVSSLICNAYLGGMERGVLLPRVIKARSVLSGTKEGKLASNGEKASPVSLLIRLTDDWLFASEDPRLAAIFRTTLGSGCFEYGVTVNVSKTQASFSLSDDSTTAVPIPDARPVTWCGLLVCPLTGAVTSDYSRYVGPGAIADSVAVSFGPSVEEAVLRMSRSFLRPKCHPVLLDGHINTGFTIALNLFQMALIAAAKIVVVLSRLPSRKQGRWQRPEQRTIASSSSTSSEVSKLNHFAVRVTLDAADYLVSIVRRRCPGRRDSALAAAPTAVENALGAPLSSDAASNGVLLVGPWSMYAMGENCCSGVLGGSRLLDPAAAADLTVTSPLTEPKLPAWCPLHNSEIKWLALTAFARAFSRAKNRFPPVVTIGILKARHESLSHSAPSASPATDGSTPVASNAKTAAKATIRAFVRLATSSEKTPWFERIDF